VDGTEYWLPLLAAASNRPAARAKAAEIVRRRTDAHGHVIELTGDIVKPVTLPGGRVPAAL
jgi:hypothetical protein